MPIRGRIKITHRTGLLALAVAVLLLAAGTAGATHGASDADQHSTLEQTIQGDGTAGYQGLTLGPGEAHTVREDLNAGAVGGRADRRRSLLYFGQLTDFQLVDEESPARAEFLDPFGGPVTSAFRPMEALTAHGADQAVRQVNAFAGASPVAGGDGSRRAMDFAITTGDSADNMQKNETEGVIAVLAGGQVNPNSGVPVAGGLPAGTPPATCTPLQQALLAARDAEAARYTGVQDYDDYAPKNPDFYDPDDVLGSGPYQNFPSYPGLMDRAQVPFTAEGLSVPAYVTFGNHDALAQGNEDASRAIEDIAIGCTKPFNSASTNLADFFAELADPDFIPDLIAAGNAMTVHPDPARQFVSKAQYKKLHEADPHGNDFGFNRIDPAEEAASEGAAGYYSYSPAPGFRFIAVDTVSEGGVTGPSATGNIDDPQFQWLRAQLEEAATAEQRVILFSHHGPQTLEAPVPDELAPPCDLPESANPTGPQHGHDHNPGCDLDPRISTPIHLYDQGPGTVQDLLFEHDHVIAWVNGHSHLNSINPESDGAGGGFWDIRTAAEIDWPQQSRLLEIFDNEDGTLSIFGTILDHSAPVAAPADGDAAGFSAEQLASVGRELAFNDPQTGSPSGEGESDDRNVELLIGDPFAGPGADPTDGTGGSCAEPVLGTPGDDLLLGDERDDGIRGLAGDDLIRGGAGDDCLWGNRGADRLRGAKGSDRLRGGKGPDDIRAGPGDDRIKGGRGADRLRGGGGDDQISGNRGRDLIRGGAGSDFLRGGKGRDRIFGGPGDDRINVRGGGRDRVNCGSGEDVVLAGRRDRVHSNCETVRRPK